MRIRPAASTDIAAVAAIYAHHVTSGLGTFEETAPTTTQIAHRWRDVCERGLPYLVAEEPGGAIAGFAYASPFRSRSAYCQGAGIRQVIAVIGDSRNVGSVALHAALGFEQIGLARDVGFKHQQWLDIVLMQRTLGPRATR